MWRYLIGRGLQTVLSMLVVISIVFVLTRLSGNPVHLLLDVNASERDQQILMHHLGLDRPLPVQYGIYVKNIFMGDFGSSVLTRRPVTEHIWERLPATVELGFVAMFLSVLIGVPLGMYSAGTPSPSAPISTSASGDSSRRVSSWIRRRTASAGGVIVTSRLFPLFVRAPRASSTST